MKDDEQSIKIASETSTSHHSEFEMTFKERLAASMKRGHLTEKALTIEGGRYAPFDNPQIIHTTYRLNLYYGILRLTLVVMTDVQWCHDISSTEPMSCDQGVIP